MELKSLPTLKLKPDKNQPRKVFNESTIEGMAKSMKGEGVVTPIEIDVNNVIICGERRWRAAKLAGLKEIPCVINTGKLKPKERLMRQCVENAHHSDMTAMDTARAWKVLLTSPGAVKRKGERYSGTMWLSNQLGVVINTVKDIISLLDESLAVQKELSRAKPDYGYTWFRDANRIQDAEQKEIVKKKILKGEFRGREDVDFAYKALNKHPDKAQDILSCFTKDGIKRELEDITGELPRMKKKSIEEENPDRLANRADMYIFRLERDLETIMKVVSVSSPSHQRKVFETLIRLHMKLGRIIKSAKMKKLK